MKNKAFQDYVTGTAFAIHLSKRQYWGLLSLLDRKNDHWLYSGQFISIGMDLRARGLVEIDSKLVKKKRESREIGKFPCHRLTKAGRLLVNLLIEAGLSMKNTRTLSVVKGQDCWDRQTERLNDQSGRWNR